MALSKDSEKRAKQLANLKPFTGEDDPRRGVGKKRLPITEALQKFFENPDNVRAYIESAAKHARNGSGTHFKEINERVEGKIAEKVEHTGADGEPIEHTIRFGVSKPEPSDER